MSYKKNKTDVTEIGVHVRAEILQMKHLTDREKILLAAICQIYKSRRECFARNDYFARWLGIPVKEVTANITKLVRKNLISRHMKYKGKEVEKRLLTPNYRQLKFKKKYFRPKKSGSERVPQKTDGPLPQTGQDNRE